MEDMLELIIGFTVIVIAICVSASKNSRKKRPGQKTASVRKEPDKPTSQAKPRKRPAAAKAKAAPKTDMTPEAMIPEPMQPESMIPELQRMGMDMSEGESRGDANGCLGGSMDHDESSHQGVEFHADGMHGVRRVRPKAAEPQVAIAPMASAAQLRSAVIWSEILDKPVSMRE